MRTPQTDFKFRRNQNIGEMDAESDRLLSECFLDTGDLNILKDLENPNRVIVGRTGSGKTALLQELLKNSENDKIKIVNLADHALRFLENTTILSISKNLNINLERFYVVLWEHIFLSELIKLKYSDPAQPNNVIKRLLEHFTLKRDRAKITALQYLSEHGDSLWLETDQLLNEITSRFVEESKDALTISLNKPSPFVVEAASSDGILTDETTKKIFGQRIYKLIDDLKLKELSNVFDLLSEEMFAKGKFYLIVDHLDKEWISASPLKCELVKALLDTVKKFQRIKNCKIIIALRTDLLKETLDFAAKSFEQREKYESLFLKIKWNKTSLTEVINKRINHQFKHKYTNSEVFFDDIFPQTINGIDTLKYAIDRTFLRPRECIQFVNTCITNADGQTMITEETVKLAEGHFVQERFHALEDEWRSQFPYLRKYLSLINNTPEAFVSADCIPNFDDFSMQIMDLPSTDPINQMLIKELELPTIDQQKIIFELLSMFYTLGLIGVRLEDGGPVLWSFFNDYEVSPDILDIETQFYIHRSLFKLLKTR